MNEIHIRAVIDDFLNKLKVDALNTFIQNFNIQNNLDVPDIRAVVTSQSKNQFPEIFLYVNDVIFAEEDLQKNYNYLAEYDVYISIALKTNELAKIDLWLNCYLEIFYKFLYDFKTDNIAYTKFISYKKEKAEIKDLQILYIGIVNLKAYSFL